MATGKKPSRKGQKVLHPHATYFECKNGNKHAAYKAGELFGCPGHRTFTHQPCAHALTDGALQCKYCAAGLPEVWRGYLPLWDVDWCLRYLLVNEDYEASVDAIPWKAQVMCSRAKNPISPIVVREEHCLIRELPNREPWDQPVDVRHVCLTLWCDDSLTKWFQPVLAAPKPSDNPLSLTKSDGTPFGPMTAAAARRFAPPANNSDPVSIEEADRQVLARLQAAHKNGNGKHTKK